MKDQKKTCPSALCEPGAKLLGVVDSDGMVDLLKKPFFIDEEFVREARNGRQPELRFRFANKCAQSGCRQWTGRECGVIINVLEALPESKTLTLPDCGIRPTCRWFFQEGDKACKICPMIVTDNSNSV